MMDKVIKAGLGLLLIAVPLFFIYRAGEGYYFSIYGEAKEALTQIVILVLFCAWLLKMNSTGLFQLRKTPLNLPLAVFFLIILLSLLWAKNPYESLKFIRRWASHILLYFIVVNNVKTLREIKLYIALMVLTAIGVAGYGLAQYYGWEFPHLHQVITRNATLGNPGFAGDYLMGVIPLALALSLIIPATHPKGYKLKGTSTLKGTGCPTLFEAGRYGANRPLVGRLYYLAALILFTHLIVAQSRATWIGFLMVIIIARFILRLFRRALLLNIISIVVVSNLSLILITPSLVKELAESFPRPKAKRCALTTPGAVSGTGSDLFRLDGAISARTKTAPTKPKLKPPFQFKPSDPWWIRRCGSIFNLAYGTNRQRIEIWRGVLRMIKARPFLGVGIGNFNLIYPLYQTKEGLAVYGPYHFIRQAHNEYLQFSAELGLVGLAGFLWFATVLVRGLWRKMRTAAKPSETLIYFGFLGSILATLAAAAFSFNLQNEASSLYFWFIVGLSGVLLNRDRLSQHP